MTDLRYNADTDNFENVEILSPDAIDKQIALWQSQIDEKNSEIKFLNDQIANIQSLNDQRTAAIQNKGK